MPHNNSLNAAKVLLPVVGLLVVSVVVGFGIAYFPMATQKGYAPEQPIPFSHRLHAGANKIACNYCHSGVEKSRHATIPAVSVCMNCHSVVKVDSPWIQKIQKAYKDGEAIQWIRVHELPDYVYFSHKRHIAKGLVCENCHGDVKAMDTIVQSSALTMGWCMECHRGNTTPYQVLEAHSAAQSRAVVQQSFLGKPHPAVAPTDCNTCHN